MLYNCTCHISMHVLHSDFFVEHLSSTLNIAEELDSISGLLLNRSVHKAVHLKDVALIRHPKIRIFDDVVAIIPFAMTSGLMHSASGFENQQLRLMFFEQTFWSIYRYFPCIAISVTRKRDYDGLMSLNLPFFHVFADFDQEEKQPVQFNVKMGLKHMHEMLTQNSTWRSRFRFVYFSEGDSILHMRSSKSLYDAMSAPALRGELILTPHRMQVESVL